MAKYTLKLDEEYNFDLIGLCSHQQDYRVCWSINKQLELRLEKSIEPFVVYGKKNTVTSQHSFFFYEDENNGLSYYLIKNQSAGKHLIPEKSQIDFFLMIKENSVVDTQEILDKLKKTPEVLTAFEFDPYALKSAHNLVF
ncbi:MAG TPA: IPExxxVDY family protein [Brumimicrobium sp.]|nr:IPExxxVDY family protein [Brumimicrobium sp.]